MHRWLARAVLVAAVLALGSCSDEPRLSPLKPGDVVLAFGDSITYGTGAPDGDDYPQVLAELTGLRVVNRGVPGEISARGLARLSGVLDAVKPKLVILCHGGNDILQRQPMRRTADNLRAMIRAIRKRGAEVVLVGVPRFSLLLDTAPIYHEVAEELAVPFEADVLAQLLGDNDLKADTVHPNSAGYRQMAVAIEKLLRDRGAL